MIRLDLGNVLLKRSHRKQLMAWLKRATKLGERIGDFVLTIRMSRIGKAFEVNANVKDAVGVFDCRTKQSDWRGALREMVRLLVMRLHGQQLQIARAVA